MFEHLDPQLRGRMLAYYDERAPEYEEAYTRGTGTASITEPEVFKAEAVRLAGIVRHIVDGRIVDLACGTAYWLPHYSQNCGHITLFDQSNNMLAEARRKAARLGVLDKCDVVRGDFFEHEFGAERAKFNAKVERQARQLNDGTAFDIYKRYCDPG